MLRKSGKITVIVITILLLGMTLLHQSREYTSMYSSYTNDGYYNVNYMQYEMEIPEDEFYPSSYLYFSFAEMGLLTISLMGIIVALYLLVVKAKDGVFFTSDKVKLLGYILLLLVSISSVFLLFPNNLEPGPVHIPSTNMISSVLTAFLPFVVLVILNYKYSRKLLVSFLLTLLFIISIIFMSTMDMYWFILVLEVMGSVVVVSLLLDDIAKLNATVYTVYKEKVEE